MKNKFIAILSTTAISTLLASITASSVYAFDGDIYEIKEGKATLKHSYKDAATNGKVKRDILRNREKYGYEYNGKIYNYMDVNKSFLENGKKRDEALKAIDKTDKELGKVEDIVIDNKVVVKEVSAITNTNVLTVNLKQEVTAENLAGKVLTLTPAEGEAIEATFKSVKGKVATFEFNAEAVETTYVVSGEDFDIAEGTKVVYDKTAPTLKVEETKFSDYKTMIIALSEKVTGTPEVKIDGTVEPVKNVTLSEDGMSLTVTREAGFGANTYNVVVNGLKDEAANAMADATVKVKKDGSYIKEFVFITTGLENAKKEKVYFTVKDQYGQDVTSRMAELDDNIEVSGKMGAFPLKITTHKDGNNYVVIEDELTKQSKVTLTLTNKVDGKVVVTATTPEYIVSDVTKEQTSIDSITVDNAVKTSGTQNIELTADVRDQYGNPIDVTGSLRWTTSDKSIVAFNSNHGSDFVDGEKTKNTINVDALAEGTATIQAFLPDGTPATKPLTITVNQGNLKTIVAGVNANISVVNNATVKDTNIVMGGDAGKRINFQNSLNNDIVMKAEDVTLTVKDAEDKDASAVVSLEKVADENGNLTGLKVATNRADQSKAIVAGNPNKVYTVTVSAAGKTATFTVTSTIDTAINTITVGKIPENALTEGGTYVTPVTFKNQYGEILEVKENENLLQFSNLAGVTLADAKNTDGTEAINGDVISHVKFTGVNAGTYNAFIATGNATVQVPITVSAAGNLNGIELGNASVSVIKDDVKDAATAVDTDNIVVDDGNTYVLVPVSAVDNYGNDIDLSFGSASNKVKSAGKEYDWTKTGGENLSFKFFQNLGGTKAEKENDVIKYIGVSEDELADATAQRNVIFAVKDGATTVATSNLTVNVTAARALDKLVVTPETGTAVVNAKTTFKLSGIDQYGREFDINNGNLAQTIKLVPQEGLVLADQASSGDNDVTFTLQGTVEGKYIAKLYYDPAGQNVDNSYAEGITKSIDVPLTVGEVGSAIDHIAVQPSVVYDDDTTSGGGVIYDASKYMVKVAGKNHNQNITFTAKGYDVNNNEITTNSGDIIYNVASVTPAEGGELTATDCKFVGNVLTINSNTHNVLDGDKIVVRATSLNGKTTTFTVTLGVAEGTAQAGTYFISDDADGYDEQGKEVEPLTNVELKEVEADGKPDVTVNGKRSVYLVARDQYGKLMDIKENAEGIVYGQDSLAFFTKANDDDSINITAKAVGSSTLRVLLNGEQITTVTITVDQDAVDAVAKKQAKQALTAKIAEVATVEQGKIEGGKVGNQIEGSKDTLDKAKIEAEDVFKKDSSTTEQLTQATERLNNAIEAYKNAKVVDISSSLVAPTLSIGGTKTGLITGYTKGQTEILNVTSDNEAVTVDNSTGLAVTGVTATTKATITVQVKDADNHVIKIGTVDITPVE